MPRSARIDGDVVAWLMSTRPWLLVVLAPLLEVARHRNATREPAARVDYDFAHTGENMLRDIAQHGWWFDTGDLTPEETADRIVKEASTRAVVGL